ncbi:MAG: DoxX family protein [candidate division Zixibacteria bacterium]|nr:DoxX family protein [candidate division Zixibacteria bacterium]
MNYIVPLGRILFSLIFITAGLGHFSKATIGFAASQGVPLASIAVPFSGVLALLGGLSVALGYKARWGALLLAAFIVPVTVMMHKFWGLADPMAAQMQQIMFMKNVTMLGGALLIAYFGTGPLSLDVRRSISPVA